MTNSKDLSAFKDKKVAVIGCGVEGVESVRFFSKHQAHVTLFDQKEEDEIDSILLSELKAVGCTLVFGRDAFSHLGKFDLVVRSPGIRKDTEFLQKAEEGGAIVTSQTKLFFDLSPARIIAVTGTKGKGTTATLIYEMLKRAGKDTFLGGNIGVPPLSFLEKVTKDSVVVLELSSFQLHDLTKSPHIAVMLMVVPEHLDYHKDLEEYIDAKRNLLRFQSASDFAVINRDYIITNESDVYTDGKVFLVSREREVPEGTFIKDNAIWIRKDGGEKKIIDTDKILLVGKHNIENASAAAMAATLAGISFEDIKEVLSTFKGLEHRLELVREVNNIRYYNDSFSTTPETAIAAIESFTEPEILILGGSSKDSNFDELGKTIRLAKNIKAIIGIGFEWERIKEAIGNPEQEILMIDGATDMATVVQAASKIATSGDVVLLSPACASFGMFKNYKDRGNQFKKEVINL